MPKLDSIRAGLKNGYDFVNRHGVAVGVIVSIVVSAIFWWLSVETRELSYSVRSNRSILFDSENPLGFELHMPDKRTDDEQLQQNVEIYSKSLKGETEFFREPVARLAGFKIEKNVYTAQLLLWNSGTLPIKREHIQAPIIISMDLDVRVRAEDVLDVRVSNSSRKEINVKGDVRESAPIILDGGEIVKPKTEYILDWNILEAGDYAVIQVVYAGDEDAEILVEGTIEGQNPIKRVDLTSGDGVVTKQAAFTFAMIFGLIQVLLAWGIAASKIPWWSENISSDLTSRQTGGFIGMVTSFLIMLGFLWWSSWNSFPIDF